MDVANLKDQVLAALQSLLDLSKKFYVEDEWTNLISAKKRIEALRLEDEHLKVVEVVLKSFLLFLENYILSHTGEVTNSGYPGRALTGSRRSRPKPKHKL